MLHLGFLFLFSEAKLDLVTSNDTQIQELYCNSCDSLEIVGKPAYELIHEDVSKQDVHPSVKSGPLSPLPSCQIKKPRQSKSANSSRKQLNDSDSLDSKGSIGREFPPNNLSLDDLVRYINGESLKKVCSRKTSTPAGTLPQTAAVNTKKSKKQPVKKPDGATASKDRVPLAANRPRKTTKKPNHVSVVRTEKFTEDSSPQEGFCDVDIIATSSTAATGITASAKEATSASDAEHEDENAEQEEFIAVLHKKRVKTRKEPHLSQDLHSACVVSLRTKVTGHQPEKASARIDRDLGASTASVFSISSKSYRSDTSGGSITSKHGSLSSLDESPPLATYETSALGTSSKSHGHSEATYSRPSFNKFSAGNSYASALLQNLPKLSVTGSSEVSQTEPGTVESATFSSPLNSEAENEMLLSPPQSEADTGFSSSSSLSPDEAHISLASDSAVMMSKRNEVVDSGPRNCLLDESSMLKHTADDVLYENLEQPCEECIVQNSVSCPISNLDFPLTRISELSGRTDEVQQYNAGESSLACGTRDSSVATTQSKNAPVIFDTRIRAVTHKMSNSDIVFLFDAEDSGTDAMSNAGNYVPVDDIDGITFTSSPDSMSLETGASQKASIQYTVSDVEASFEMKTSVESGDYERTDKPNVKRQRAIRVTDDQTSHDEYIPQRDSEYENPVNDGKLVESSVNEVVRSASHGSFDLLAAQKFLSQGEYFQLMSESNCY